jgi:hypothetical protein
MIYALVTYHWRANSIRKRGSGPYDDRFGPTMLCVFLLGNHSRRRADLGAVIVNFALRLSS